MAQESLKVSSLLEWLRNGIHDPNKRPAALLVLFFGPGFTGSFLASIGEGIGGAAADIAIFIAAPLFLISFMVIFYWAWSGIKGAWILYRKGYIFPNGIGIGTALLILFLGWIPLLIAWEVICLGGAFWYKYAHNKPEKPVCTACKTRNELGATRCHACSSYIELAPKPV